MGGTEEERLALLLAVAPTEGDLRAMLSTGDALITALDRLLAEGFTIP